MSNYTASDFGLETNVFGIISGINELTNGWFAALLLIFTFFIMISMNYSNTRDLGASLITSSFITFVVSVLLWAIDMISLYVVVLPLVFLVGAVLMRLIANK
jgi:hypothetical protein